MNDLISRQAALDIINAELNGWLTDDERLHLEGVGIAIELLPFAQKRGKWMDNSSSEHWKCSECGDRAPMYWDANRQEYDEWLAPFCPSCGARMVVNDG